MKRKLSVILFSLFLTAGSIVCAESVQNPEDAAPQASAAAEETAAPDSQINVVIKEEEPTDKYLPINKKGSVVAMCAEVSGVSESDEVTYRWYSGADRESGTAVSDADSDKCSVTVNKKGKKEYWCEVSVNGETIASDSIVKVGYNSSAKTVAVGSSFSTKDIFGMSLKAAADNQAPKIAESGKKACMQIAKAKETITVKKYYSKGKAVTVKFTPADAKKAISIKVYTRLPNQSEMQKKVRVRITNNKQKLTVYYKDIMGVSVIKFKEKNGKPSVSNLKKDNQNGNVSYFRKEKYKSKNFKVLFGYRVAGKTSPKYISKWIKIKDVK